jgi:hypothetical protein
MGVTGQQIQFLRRKHLPGTLSATEIGYLLGFDVGEITLLERGGLLISVGRQQANGLERKMEHYFCWCDVAQKTTDRDWLNRATETIQSHWRRKNERT